MVVSFIIQRLNLTDAFSKVIDNSVTSAVKQGMASRLIKEDGSCFEVFHHQVSMGQVSWNLVGRHNVEMH